MNQCNSQKLCGSSEEQCDVREFYIYYRTKKIKDFFSKCDQIRSFLRLWSHLLKKSLMENCIFSCSAHFFRESTFMVKKRFLYIFWASFQPYDCTKISEVIPSSKCLLIVK